MTPTSHYDSSLLFVAPAISRCAIRAAPVRKRSPFAAAVALILRKIPSNFSFVFISLFCLTVFSPNLVRADSPVEGRIRRVGLFEGGIPQVRPGDWTFIEVELRYQGSAPFEGQLRVEQLDRDGDVVISAQDVALAPSGDWRPYQVYFVHSSASSPDPVHLKLYNNQGHLTEMTTDTGTVVSELVSDAPTRIDTDEILILDLSQPRKLPHAAMLASTSAQRNGSWMNTRLVRALAPRELPSRWLGLSGVDAIIWDDADPSMLSQQQVDALMEWIKMGGRILITSGKNWQNLSRSPLAAVLPVTITGSAERNEALEFLDIVNDEQYNGRLSKTYFRDPILRCQMAAHPEAIKIPAKDEGNQQIAYRNLFGRGTVTFVGASLLDLLPPPSNLVKADEPPDEMSSTPTRKDEFVRICEKVLARVFLGLPRQLEQDNSVMGYSSLNLFDLVRETINFGRLSSAFLIFAILFALIYSLLSTCGTYFYLKRRGMVHHCWTAFALASIVGIVIGTAMVWTLRGFSTKLWQTSVVDAHAGETYGYASCLFGVKTPDHSRLDLRLPVGAHEGVQPDEMGTIGSMPGSTSTENAESKFVAPESYESTHGGSILEKVPIRATLKEFRGAWHGPTHGTVEAKLVIDGDGRIGPGSFIHNKLGVALKDCYLLEATQELAGAGPLDLTRCFLVGTLDASGNGANIEGEELAERFYFDKPKTPADKPTLKRADTLLLSKTIKSWRGELPRNLIGGYQQTDAPVVTLTAEQTYYSMLLLSVYDLIEMEKAERQILHRSHGRMWNCTQQLTSSTAILIGHSDAAPPAVLEANLTSLQPEKARTMYRFVIPVDRTKTRSTKE